MMSRMYLLCLPLLLSAAACRDRGGAAAPAAAPAGAQAQPMDPGGGAAGVNRGDPIRDTSIINTTGDVRTLTGRGIQLSGAPVRRVLSQRVFTIETKEGPEVFVVVDDVVGRSRTEVRADVSAGLVVNLFGVVQHAPLGDGGSERPVKGLSDSDAAALENQRFYILAQEVKPQQR